MNYLSVAEIAKEWGISERTVRNYCAAGKVPGAFLTGKTWNLPEDTQRPERKNKHSDAPENLLEFLQDEKSSGVKGGIYHKIQIDLTYHSNHMEGNHLLYEQIRYIYETNAISVQDHPVNVDDIVETANHFCCIDTMIEQARQPISEAMLKQFHLTLKNGTSDSRKDWFMVGDYKKLPNEAGGRDTTPPEQVASDIKQLMRDYNTQKEKTLDDLLDFHVRFERIHPFQDGNGRIGRLLLFKECLKHNIAPFIITDDLKSSYYCGLHEWDTERGYLRDTCLTAQDAFKANLNYFRIPYRE